MTKGIKIKRQFHLGRGQCNRRQILAGAKAATPLSSVPRISRLMALAIRFDQLIDGVVKDQAELARLGHVSRARLTQIMNLLNLCPHIQQNLLFLPESERHSGVSERALRSVLRVPCWDKQLKHWEKLNKWLRIAKR